MQQLTSSKNLGRWKPSLSVAIMLWLCSILVAWPAAAAEVTYPTTIHTRYEAIDPKVGGQFIIWLDREKVWHGVDPRLPAVRYVDVTHLTPSQGSGPITIIEVAPINLGNPEFYQFTGFVRFKVTGMTLKISNTPADPSK